MLLRVRTYLSVCASIARAIAFFLTTAFLGPISGDQVNGLRFFCLYTIKAHTILPWIVRRHQPNGVQV